MSGDNAASQDKPSPPPPLPKRSPIASEGGNSSDLISFEPPPKPQRSPRHSEEREAGEVEGSGVNEGHGHVPPKKPTRASIIRPPPHLKATVENATSERLLLILWKLCAH
jgi:hypothetical protein